MLVSPNLHDTSLPLLIEKKRGNRRRGKIAPLTPASSSSFAKWRVPLLPRPFVSVTSFSAITAAVFKLEPVIAPYFIASKQWRLDLQSISGVASVEAESGRMGGRRIINGRIARYVTRPTAFFRLLASPRHPTKCPIINEALRFGRSGFRRLGKLAFEFRPLCASEMVFQTCLLNKICSDS